MRILEREVCDEIPRLVTVVTTFVKARLLFCIFEFPFLFL